MGPRKEAETMRVILAVALVLVCARAEAIIGDDYDIVMRGDVNHNGVVNSSDAVYLGNFLYSGGPPPPCMNEADANHDGIISAGDQVFILNFLFKGGPAPPTPGPYNSTCTISPAPIMGCSVGC
jgi:hypothetical protein